MAWYPGKLYALVSPRIEVNELTTPLELELRLNQAVDRLRLHMLTDGADVTTYSINALGKNFVIGSRTYLQWYATAATVNGDRVRIE